MGKRSNSSGTYPQPTKRHPAKQALEGKNSARKALFVMYINMLQLCCLQMFFFKIVVLVAVFDFK
jgi:hypothetical protein